MALQKKLHVSMIFIGIGCTLFLLSPVFAQLTDVTQTPNAFNEGIHKSLTQEIGFGRGDEFTVDSSLYLIKRDPFRAIRRGRQLFQRKFTENEGQGPRFLDGVADANHPITKFGALGAGLGDSCANCHGRPRGSAGFGGSVFTRPNSRDAPHLFGLGLREMLADEITTDLRAIQAKAFMEAKTKNVMVTKNLVSKGISYGSITASPDGSLNTTNVQGVNPDLRVRPFFAQGGTISIREFLVGAAKNEMGFQAVDPDLYYASTGGKITTPSGMVLDGSIDQIEAPPGPNALNDPDPDRDGVVNEMPQSLVDFLEFYLMNYFVPATYQKTAKTEAGRVLFTTIGCSKCHIPNLSIVRDRRVADIDTVYDPVNGIFNNLFATASTLYIPVDDHSGLPPMKLPALNPTVVENIFTDFKRHNLGPKFWERNFDGTIQKEFLTRPLWGVGSTAPYGHDGRSINLTEVILRHGGEAQASRDAFAKLSGSIQDLLLEFLNYLVLFPPDDTASNLDPGNRSATNFPQVGHGGIKLTVLFNDPTDLE
jgi:hypothetical protein